MKKGEHKVRPYRTFDNSYYKKGFTHVRSNADCGRKTTDCVLVGRAVLWENTTLSDLK